MVCACGLREPGAFEAAALNVEVLLGAEEDTGAVEGLHGVGNRKSAGRKRCGKNRFGFGK
jgi:hypothetical protein